jgi:hypothetical protein
MLINIIIHLKFYFYYLFKTIYLSTLVILIDTVISTAYTKIKLNYNRAQSFGSIKPGSVKYAYFLPFIFSKLSPNITAETEPIITYTFYMFILN